MLSGTPLIAVWSQSGIISSGHFCYVHCQWTCEPPFTGQILFLMTWFGVVQISHSCQILSVNGTCLSLATSVVPPPVKTILELFGHAFGVLPKTGDAEPVDRGKPG